MTYRLVPLHQRLANALTYNEFVLFYQPIVDLADESIHAVEALCRWRQRDGLALPDSFIPQAEASGIIVQLGRWVLLRAARQVADWQRRLGRPLRLAVNLSARQFMHFDLVKHVEEALADAQLAPQSLELEITESVAMHSAQESIGVMRQLKNLGISLALDDFGTGYSSLSYLKRFPIDQLKVDKSFVRDIPDDANDIAIVSAIIAMAHALDLSIVAEGVETKAQSQFLRECGCQFAQGYHYSRPLPPEEMEALLAAEDWASTDSALAESQALG